VTWIFVNGFRPYLKWVRWKSSLLFPIAKTKWMPAPLPILPLLEPSSLKRHDMMCQILGGQRIKSHDTEFIKIQYVENGNASGITGEIADVIPNKKIDLFFVHRYPLNE